MNKTKKIVNFLLLSFFLTGCFLESDSLKEEATLDALIESVEDNPGKTLKIEDYTKENQGYTLCNRYDTSNPILPVLKTIHFKKRNKNDPGPAVHSRNLCAFTDHHYHSFYLSDDLINVLFFSDNGLGYGNKRYSNYRKVSYEDGVKIRDTIKKAYREGKPVEDSSYCELQDEYWKSMGKDDWL